MKGNSAACVLMSLVCLIDIRVFAPAEAVECYQFTWEQNNNATDCDEQRDIGIPCFKPFILTVPQSEPPNITDLDLQCSMRDCPTYTCVVDNKQCLHYARYNMRNEPVYISVFCGSIFDVTKADSGKDKVADKGCYHSKNDSITIQACSCDTYKCNGSTAATLSPCHLAVAVLAAILLWQSLPSHPHLGVFK